MKAARCAAWGRGEQLYYLPLDPAEQNNLAPRMQEKAAELRVRLQQITAESTH